MAIHNAFGYAVFLTFETFILALNYSIICIPVKTIVFCLNLLRRQVPKNILILCDVEILEV